MPFGQLLTLLLVLLKDELELIVTIVICLVIRVADLELLFHFAFERLNYSVLFPEFTVYMLGTLLYPLFNVWSPFLKLSDFGL